MIWANLRGAGRQDDPQGLDERFGPQAAEFLQMLLDHSVSELIASEPIAITVLRRFSRLRSTTARW